MNVLGNHRVPYDTASVVVQSLSYVQLFCNSFYSQPGSSVHGIPQARILEWVAISSFRGIFPTQGSNLHLLHCRQIFTTEPPGKPHCLLRNATNPIQREMAGVTGESSDGDSALGGGWGREESGTGLCEHKSVDQRQGQGSYMPAILVGVSAVDFQQIFVEHLLSVVCWLCATHWDGYFISIFSPFLPMMLYVPYSLIHKEMEAHRD